MPYENEHSARLRNPEDFDKDSFRRTNGGTIYGSKKVPKTIGIIWAKLKGKSKPKDPVLLQSLRFPIKSWTVQKAKKWLKDNNVKYQKFEPAEKKKSKTSYAKEKTQKKYTCECIKCGHTLETDKHCKDIKCSKCGGQMRRKERPGPGQNKQSMSEDTAPTKACIFNDNAMVTFAEGDDDKKKNTFRIVGYSGGIIKEHWFWGNVAFDLEGMKFRKHRTPVLAEHFREVRIGFSTRQEISDKVITEGPFLDNADAQNLKADMLKGFPMEASLFVMPSVVEHVKEDASVNVNGLTLKGPGTVFRKSSIWEMSICVFGADSKTKSSAYADGDNQNVKFSLIQETSIMSEETQTVIEIESVESFAQLYPEFHAEIFGSGKAEGTKENEADGRAKFAALQESCGDDHELLVQCFNENKTPSEAAKLRAEKLGKENTVLNAKVTELQKEKPAVEAAQTEFADQATKPTGGDQTETDSADVETMKKEFAASKDLQTEFGNDVESYIAFKQADDDGRVRMSQAK